MSLMSFSVNCPMLTSLQMKAWGVCFHQRALTHSLHQSLVIGKKHVRNMYVCLNYASMCVLSKSWYVVPLSPFVPLYSKSFYLFFERHLRKCMPAVKAWFILHCICTVWFCNVLFGFKSASLHLCKEYIFLISWLFCCAYFWEKYVR